MRILVTGISGLSGSIIAKRLATAGHFVIGTSRRVNDKVSELKALKEFELINTDIVDIDKYIKSIERLDVVIHCAATSPSSDVSYDKMIYDNVYATRSLIAAAIKLKVQKFIFFSSISINGQIEDDVLDEDTSIINPGVYGITKSICEYLLSEQQAILPSICLRLPGVLGPGAHRNWLSSVADKIFSESVIPIYNAHGPFNNAVHIDDIGNLVERLLKTNFSGFHSIVLGARGVISIEDAISRLAHAMNRVPRLDITHSDKPKFILSSKRAIEHWAYDPMEIGELLDRYGTDYVSNATN